MLLQANGPRNGIDLNPKWNPFPPKNITDKTTKMKHTTTKKKSELEVIKKESRSSSITNQSGVALKRSYFAG